MPAPIVVATRDPAAIAMARSVFGGGRAPTSEQSLEAMRKVVAALQMSTRSTGSSGPGSSSGFNRSGFCPAWRRRSPPMRSSSTSTARRISCGPALALIAGALLALLAFWPFRRGRSAADASPPRQRLRRYPRRSCRPSARPASTIPSSRSTSSPEPSRSGGQHGTSPRPIPAALPRLLLLALDVSAGPEAIETAPPLGSHAEVVAILCGVIPDLAVDRIHAVLARPDGSVANRARPDDPVPTAVLDARGEAGVALVKEVLLMTGWRAFAPKTGLFVSADDLEALAALAGEGPVV